MARSLDGSPRLPLPPPLSRSFVRSFVLQLPKGTKPFVFLSITMPLEWVDVNVHPTKTEVALLHEETVADCLRQAVEETLLAHEDTRTMRVQTTLIELTQLTQQTELNTQAAKVAVDTEKGTGVGTKMNSGTAA